MAADDEGMQTRQSAGDAIEPPASFADQANVTDDGIYEAFAADWPDCWKRAGDLLDWETEYGQVLRGDGPPFHWFEDGQLNAPLATP